jgi:thiamine biosynthesis protein ThiS
MEGLGCGTHRLEDSLEVCSEVKSVSHSFIISNGEKVEVNFPCSIEQFLIAQQLLPRSVVVEHNGDAVAPSEFSHRQLNARDRLEIVRIVAGG